MNEKKHVDISDDLRDWVEKKVQSEFDRDRAFIKDTIGGALKIFGWCLAALSVGFVGLGIKTWSDVDSKITKAAEREVQQRLGSNDPNSAFRTKVDGLVDRAVLNEYLLQRSRAQSERRHSVKIAGDDIPRLMRLLTSPSTDDALFGQAVRVVQLVEDQKTLDGINHQLISMVSASDAENRWIREQPAKRAILLQLVNTYELSPIVRRMIEDHDLIKDQPGLATAAVKAAARLDLVNVADDLESIAGSDNETLAQAAFEALAQLKPNSRFLEDRVKRIESTTSPERAAEDLAIAGKAILGHEYLDRKQRDPYIELRHDLATRLFARVIADGFAFSDTSADPAPILTIRKIGQDTSSVQVSQEVLFGSSGQELVALAAKRAVATSMEQLRLLVRAVTIERTSRRGGVYLTVGAGKVVLVGGITLDNKTVPSRLLLRADAADNALHAVWIDAAGIQQEALIKQIVTAEDMRFDLANTRDIYDEEGNVET